MKRPFLWNNVENVAKSKYGTSGEERFKTASANEENSSAIIETSGEERIGTESANEESLSTTIELE